MQLKHILRELIWYLPNRYKETKSEIGLKDIIRKINRDPSDPFYGIYSLGNPCASCMFLHDEHSLEDHAFRAFSNVLKYVR